MGNIGIWCLSIALVSCGTSKFSGDTGVQPTEKAPVEEPQQQVATQQQATPNQNANPIERLEAKLDLVNPDDLLDDSPDGLALKACLRNWNMHQVDPSFLNNRKIMEGHSNGPLASSEVADLDYTDTDQLVLVKVSANGPLAGMLLKLMNPKGMYCIQTDANGPLADMTIEKHCKARIGSNQSSVNGPLAQQTTSITACD